MYALLTAVLALGLFAADDEAKKDAKKDGKKDLQALQGTWQGVSGEGDGQALPAEVVESYELTISGDKYTLKVKGKDQEDEQGTIKVDASKKPAAIDITISKGEQQGKSQKAIYQVEGDKLTLCYAQPEKDRPKGLKTQPNSEETCLVFKRVKR